MPRTTATTASTRVESKSGRISRHYCTVVLTRRRLASGGGGEIGTLQPVEDARPLDRLCKDDLGAGLPRPREVGLAVPGHDDHAGASSRGGKQLADQHVARNVGQPEV